MATPREPTPW